MLPHQLDDATLNKLQMLVEKNFSGRDELQAAAKSMHDDDRKQVCKQLAQHLASHAIELEQILLAAGAESAEPLDTHAIAERLFELAKANSGEERVLEAAESCERDLKEEYDGAIQATRDREAEALLEKQREDVDFGERVLRGMKHPSDSKDND